MKTFSGLTSHLGLWRFNNTVSSLTSPHLLKTPSTPVMPIPSTMSLESLKGTVSGVGRIFPCSKATPEHKTREDEKRDARYTTITQSVTLSNSELWREKFHSSYMISFEFAVWSKTLSQWKTGLLKGYTRPAKLSTHSARLHSLTFSEEENKLSMFTHANEWKIVPKSMCTSSAVCSSIRIFWMCRSPRPTM